MKTFKMNEKWDNLAEILRISNNIIFFGGAGTSKETRFKCIQNKNRSRN
ncbi:NAD-dependent deacetylase [Cetobacterium somerae]|nr:NAD-dependent deacetylase [Cetobacterium somerae]